MEVTQPNDVAALTNATSLEVLKNLFEGEPLREPSITKVAGTTSEAKADTTASQSVDPVITVVEATKAADNSPATTSVQSQVLAESNSAQSEQTAGVSRADLVNVLESFVNLIKNTPGTAEEKTFAVQNTLSFDPSPEKVTLHVDDQNTEVEELRCLLVEAQETIIRLLTDRVEDRARISRLETELKLLPDLQTQADRALAVAMNTEDFRSELTKVKFELERVRLAKVRRDVDKNPRSFWRGMRGWFFKTNKI